jgi:thiol-disulfide isomerase/thioredoxin
MVSLFLLTACAPSLYTDGEVMPWEAPSNDWGVGEVPSDLEAEGFGVGEVVTEFRLPDQFGEEVSLWQFYGKVVILDISTLWCAPCQDLAEEVEATYEQYASQEFEYITILPEDLEYEVPDTAELNQWVDAFGLTRPVLADDQAWAEVLVPAGGYPRLLLIGRDMRVLDPEIFPATDARIREVVEEAL